MPRVKGPNGHVLTVSDEVAKGLLVSEDYQQVEDEPKSESKSTAKRSSSKK